jgi:integrase
MSIFKRGSVYWYHFLFNGEHIQKSTKQGNPRTARQIEAAHRTALAKGEIGITKKTPVPTLAEFIEDRFTPWARATFEKASPKTWTGWYRTQLGNISAYPTLVNRKLDTITSEHAADYAAHLQTKGWQPSSVNSSLRVLRRVLRLAVEWGVSPTSPKIKLLRGEHHRDRVVTQDEEMRYLAAAGEQMADIATVLVDTGMRPEENSRLRWESISWTNGHCGTLQVTHGKTAAARRMLPLSPRVRTVLERRWQVAKNPPEGWVWAAATASGHVEAFHDEETAPEGIEAQWRAALCAVLDPAYVSDSLRRIGLRCLDAGKNRRSFVHCNVCPVCSPQRRCGDECFFSDVAPKRTAHKCPRDAAMNGDTEQKRHSPATVSATS